MDFLVMWFLAQSVLLQGPFRANSSFYSIANYSTANYPALYPALHRIL